ELPRRGARSRRDRAGAAAPGWPGCCTRLLEEDRMRVSEIMTRDPACASQDTSLREVARLMVEHDCGEIPVLDAQRRPIGVITDRDIVCRVVAKGMDASELEVAD